MDDRVCVLLVEDDIVDQMAFRRLVDREQLPFDTWVASSVDEARAALGDQTFDIALIDYMIGDHTAFDLFEHIKDTPMIVITGRGDEEVAVTAMKAGALDYLVKDVQGNYLQTLPLVIKNTIARRRAENELARYREHLEVLVEERTAELAVTNAQLIKEIDERKLVEEELRQYTGRLNILREIDQAILAAQSSEGIARAALLHIRRLVPCHSASVVLLDLEAGAFKIWVIDSSGPVLLPEGENLSIPALGAEVISLLDTFSRGEPVLIESSMPFTQELVARGLFAEGLKAVLTVPLLFERELNGVLTLAATSKEVFGQTQIELVSDVAGQLAIAIRQSRLHEQVQRHAAELEARVAERTAELQTANENLRVLARMKDEFVSNVSHELQTPLANFRLYCHLLTRAPEKQETYLATLQRETERLQHTIDDLLQLSRLDQERVDFTLAPVDLNELATLFVADRIPLADQQGKTLTLQTTPEIPQVIADQGLLEQVLSILVTNALSYTPVDSTVTVITQVDHTREGNTWVGFSVSDNGPGISEADQARLFERFFRGTAARESGVPGTGLGLAIAQEIVMRHQGLIEMTSTGQPGEGATFSVWLPALQQ